MTQTQDPYALDQEAIAREAADLDSGGYAFPRLKLAHGRWVVRMIPAHPSREGVFFLKLQESFNVGPNGKKIIPPSQFGMADPLMDDIQRLKALGDKASLKRANAMNPKKRVHVWAVVRSFQPVVAGSSQALPVQVTDPKTGKSFEAMGPHLWSVSGYHFTDVISILNDPDYGNIVHPVSGRDLTIDYTPKEMTKDGFPDYSFRAKPNITELGDPAWLAEDLFEKHRIGEPSEPDYIIACLKGTEEAYKSSRKEERAERESTAQHAPDPATQQSASPAPGGTEQSAVEASLEEIRRKNLQAAKGAGLPVDIRSEKHLAPPADKTDPTLLTQEFWAGVNGQTVKLTGQVIQNDYVDKGHADALQLMALDQEGGWKTATFRGFKKAVSDSPPPPPAPTGAPPPPPGESVASDLENALG